MAYPDIIALLRTYLLPIVTVYPATAAMFGVVVNEGAITAVPPATVTGVVDGVSVK